MKFLLLILAIILGGYYGYTNTHRGHKVVVNKLYNSEKQRSLERIKEKIGNQEEMAQSIYAATNIYRNVSPNWIIAIYTLESSAGRNCVANNCFGFNIYANHFQGFGSTREAVFKVVSTLSLNPTYTQWSNNLVAMACVYNTGSPTPCSYGYKFVALINSY